MKNRDEIAVLGCNSRLDSVQAVVGNWLIGQTGISRTRIENAAYYDEGFAGCRFARAAAPEKCEAVYHLYIVFAERRDELYQHCLDNGVEPKSTIRCRSISRKA